MACTRQRNILVSRENICFLTDYERFFILGSSKPIPSMWGRKRHMAWIEEYSVMSRFWLEAHSIKFESNNKVKTLVYAKGRISG